MDGGRDFGEASVEAIRYVLAGTPESDRFAVTAARLALSPIQRHDAITAINVGGPVVLSRRHKLDRQKRDAALALSWLAVLSGNPTVVRSAELGMRHDKLAADLGDEGEGIAVRSALGRWIESELDTAAKAYFS
jgi:hypothetical protein